MRTFILIMLVCLLAFLAVDSLSRDMHGPFPGHGGWRVNLFGLHVPAEGFVLGLIIAIWFLFPRRKKRPERDVPPADPVGSDLETMREVSQMLDRMERRIESLETIILDREGRAKRTAEHE